MGKSLLKTSKDTKNECFKLHSNSVFILFLYLWVHEAFCWWCRSAESRKSPGFPKWEGSTLLRVGALPLAINERKGEEAS